MDEQKLFFEYVHILNIQSKKSQSHMFATCLPQQDVAGEELGWFHEAVLGVTQKASKTQKFNTAAPKKKPRVVVTW